MSFFFKLNYSWSSDALAYNTDGVIRLLDISNQKIFIEFTTAKTHKLDFEL